MSSNYSVLCLSHDPAIIVHDPGYNQPEQAEAAIRDGIDGHADCDLMIGRYSYPLIELGCPRTADTPKHLRPSVITCYHGSTQWTDRDWLWILAAAYQSPDPDMRAAIEKGHRQQCLPWERLKRLRVELGITVKEPDALDHDPLGPADGMVIKAYKDFGEQRWLFRCWGTEDNCDGLLALGHHSERMAQQERDRHIAECHTKEPS